MAYRNDEQTQLYMTKHPIPGKSMVNFTLLQLLTTTTMPPAGSRHSDDTNVTTSTPTNTANRNRRFNSLGLTRENGSIGLLLAMKALVQLIFNPIVGNLSSRCGYRLPIMVGTCFLLLSSLGNKQKEL